MTQTQYTLLALGVGVIAVFVGYWVGTPKHRGGFGALLGVFISWVGVIAISLIQGDPETEDEKLDARSRSTAGLIVGVLGTAAVAGLFFLGQRVTEPLENTVTRMVGEQASCELEGWILIGGEREDVYGCDGRYAGGSLGCFARIGDYVQDVTPNVKTLGELGGAKLPCAYPVAS